MAVSVDASGALAHSATATVTTFDFSGITVGSGLTNSAMVVPIFFGIDNPTSITAIWDPTGTGTSTNQSLTQIIADNAPSAGWNCTQLWGLIAPTSGNRILRISWTNASQVAAAAVSFQGVNQTGGSSSFAGVSTGALTTSTTATVTIPSSTSDYCVGAFGIGPNPNAPSDTSLGTFSGTNIWYGANYGVGATSKILSIPLQSSGAWYAVGVDVIAAGSIPPTFNRWSEGTFNIDIVSYG